MNFARAKNINRLKFKNRITTIKKFVTRKPEKINKFYLRYSMSVKIEATDIVPCVYRFLQKFGYEKAANALEKATDIEPVKKELLSTLNCIRKEVFQIENC